MKLNVNGIAINTFRRLGQVRALIQVLDLGIPEVSHRLLEDLKEEAEQGSWEYGDCQSEAQILDEQLATWVPCFAAYSCVTLLHTIVEMQLLAVANWVCTREKSKVMVSDIKGGDLDRCVLFLDRIGSIKVKEVPEWTAVDDIRQLRNLIVHYGGRPTEKHRGLLERLEQRYHPKFRLEFDIIGEFVYLPLNLCAKFADDAAEFFKGLFSAAGLRDFGG